MRVFADFLIAAVELIEAQSQALQRRIQSFLVSCAILLAAVGFLVLSLVLILWGLYAALFPNLGHAAAAFITAGAVVLVAVVLLLTSKALIR